VPGSSDYPGARLPAGAGGGADGGCGCGRLGERVVTRAEHGLELARQKPAPRDAGAVLS